MHHARRLADQFRSFWNCCTQGAGQTLAGTSTSAATNHEGKHLPPTVPIQRNAADSKDDSKEPPGQSTDEGSASTSTKKDGNQKQCGKRKLSTAISANKAQQANQGKGKQQRLQRRSSVSTDRKLDVAVPLRRLRQKTAPGSGMEDIQSGNVPAEGIATKSSEISIFCGFGSLLKGIKIHVLRMMQQDRRQLLCCPTSPPCRNGLRQRVIWGRHMTCPTSTVLSEPEGTTAQRKKS